MKNWKLWGNCKWFRGEEVRVFELVLLGFMRFNSQLQMITVFSLCIGKFMVGFGVSRV